MLTNADFQDANLAVKILEKMVWSSKIRRLAKAVWLTLKGAS